MSNSLNLRRDSSINYSRLSMLIQFYCIYISYNNLYISYLNEGVGMYGGLFNQSSISIIFHILIFLLSIMIISLTGFYSRKYLNDNLLNKNTNIINKKGEQYTIIEYALIIQFIITGNILLISSSDLVSLFLSIELQSYGLYILCTIYRNSESATSSGLTYFLLGGLSSCFILLGIGLIYANSGTTYLDSFYIITNITNILTENELNNLMTKDIASYIPYCLLLITIGLLFKMSAAPLHF